MHDTLAIKPMQQVADSVGSVPLDTASELKLNTQADTVVSNYPIADRLGFLSGNEWLNTDSAVRFVGISGEPVPYRLSNDPFVTITLMLSLCMACFVICRSMYALGLQIKNFFRLRDRNEDFSLKSEGEVKDQLFVVILESFVLSLLCFSYFVHLHSQHLMLLSPYVLLFSNMGVLLAYFACKYSVMGLFNRTFFEAEEVYSWWRSYNLVGFFKAVGFLLLVMVVLYFDLPDRICNLAFLILLGTAELLVLFKTKQIFFNSHLGIVPTILYFCALELVPLVFLWELLASINEFLVT